MTEEPGVPQQKFETEKERFEKILYSRGIFDKKLYYFIFPDDTFSTVPADMYDPPR
jgi:hypothetical protein